MWGRGSALAILTAFVDQLSKAAVVGLSALSEGPMEIVPPFFSIVYVRNTGATWGFFPNNSLIIGALGCLVLFVLVLCRGHFFPHPWAFGLLCGGIVGNTVDRFYRQHVVDFLSFRIGSFEWPAFNVADGAISTSVIYLVASHVLARHPERRT